MPGRHSGSSRRYKPHPQTQAAGIEKLLEISRPATASPRKEADIEPGDCHRDRLDGLGDHYNDLHAHSSPALAAREITPGALRDHYDIPETRFNRNEARGLLLSSLVITGWVSWHLGWSSLGLLLCTAPGVTFRVVNFVLSYFDRPVVASRKSGRKLDQLHVTIAVPVYNEDPGLLDRCLYAMMNQTRPANLIWVVDDGSKTSYAELARYWVGSWSNGTEIRWMRQANQGKRRAHALVFESVPEADIFITVDSDTTLDRRAIEEGLKPFQNRKVMSVAGIELGFNAYKNFLTRMQCSLQLYAQAVTGAAWSVAGDMYTNRGPFALYWAPMVREYLSVYRDETFFGRRVILGDDSLLALCASTNGKSVQQLSAFGLTMWPETMSHHLRQRLRWARGRAVRNFWRLKYRPFTSYCWWLTVAGIDSFLLAGALVALTIAWWPLSQPMLVRTVVTMLLLSVPFGLRTLCFRRSDETLFDRLVLVLIRPVAAIWSGIVLGRVLRTWGTATLLKQGWTTRQKGAELVFSPESGAMAAPGMVKSREAAA